MRRAWIVGCVLFLAACSNKVTDSAVALTIKYQGYTPACLRVTALDATAPERKSAELIQQSKLAADEDRTLILAVYREKTWSQQLQVEVASYATTDCTGTAIETRGLGSAVTLPAKGSVAATVELLARDADKDGYVALAPGDSAIQGTDCNDTAGDIHPGATRVCGAAPDATGDVDCDGVPECAQRPNGQSCVGAAMCQSGYCVGGVCCNSACDQPPMCRGAGTCGTGTCQYPIAQDKPCDDGNGCTTNDTCNPAGNCVGGAPVTCPTRSDTCYSSSGTCIPADGGCSYAPLDAGTSCNDNSACTSGEKCDGKGVCAGGTEKVCNSGSPGWPGQCSSTVGTCIPADGGCIFPNLDAGTPCNDSDSCSHSDQCSAGACVSTAYTCTGGNECQLNGPTACAGDGGCVYSSNPAKDGKTCTLTAALSGTCVPGAGKCAAFTYAPSNFDPEALTSAELSGLKDVHISCDVELNTSGSTFAWVPQGACSTPPELPLIKALAQTGSTGGPEVLILYIKRFDVDAGKTLRLKGTRPVIFAVYDQALIHGSILGDAEMTQPGPGSDVASCTGRVGSAGSEAASVAGGGGGAGFATKGGLGGDGAGGAGAGVGGGTPGNALASTLVPLIAGCPGGAGGTSSIAGAGGAGGGAVQISVAGNLTLDGVVSVSGGGGKGGAPVTTEAVAGGGGGGGSGGGLVLEAGTLQIGSPARLTANGGSGAEGGKSGGPGGADGTDGTIDTSSVATSTGNSGTGGDGGDGAAGTKAPVKGGNEGGGGTGGGGGGGGAAGIIRLRGGTSCSIAAGVISPPATQQCP